ncbi:hypothetical protein B0T24DRAFT_539780 [Lasiosphaeria ovina]|uniref:Uncharacterized protein n=1 Tax=Lasiosphaeria ovina TaxID=92902 RepID=A0AAE0JSK3_9PEZI|nr:hypothetical protein B0T24DRAFT_539780 [Lasiosphaeria ovina]
MVSSWESVTNNSTSNIARRFREALLATANDEDASSKLQELVDKEKLRDSVQRWLENLIDEPGLVDDIPEAPSAKLDEQEMAAIPDEQKYREVAFKSPAYKWLLASLGKNASLSTGSPDDAAAVIRSQISKALPRAKAVSSKVASDVHVIAIRCDCDVETFVRHEYPDTAGEFKLGEVISITGSPTDAQALTCLAYMEQTWPSTGGDMLSTVQRAFQSGKPASAMLPIEELSDRARITASAFDGSLTLEVEGTVDVVTEMAEQIIWLAATLRSSEGDELTYCTPFIKQITTSEGKRQADVGFDLSVREPDQKLNGTCWHAMFRNPVVVRGYPIRRRPRDGVGLEVPLHIMAGLGQTTHVTEFLGKSYIKGFASMFVAVDHTDGVCNWHHLHNSDGTRISYNEAGGTSASQVPAHVLSTSRHIVGWCTKTRILAGSSNANYKVKRSGLPQAGHDFALDKISLSCGQMITGGATFSIGKKDVPIHVSKGGYVEKLRWITQRHVVLWDVEAKRGWMVDGGTALHHLLRGSLEHSRTDSFRSEFLFDFSKLKDGSAIEVLLNPEHRRLLLYPSKEETHTETITGADGETKTETKTKITYTTLGNKVEEIYTYLERMIEHKSQIENTKGFNAKVRLRRHLEGWDFSDLATNHDPSHLRVATLPASAFSWVELTRVAQAVTLFGKGFGDLLSPTTDSARNRCSSWGSVPKAKHYLCVRLADLQNIAEDSGGDILADPIYISPDLVWINPSGGDPFGCVCDVTQTQGKYPSPVQQLVPSWRRIATGSSLSLIGMGDGAVIFGQGNGFQWTWPDGKGVLQPQNNITPASPAGTTSSSVNDSSSASHTSRSVAGAYPLTPDTPMSSLSTQANTSVQSPQVNGTPKLSTTSSSESSSPARSSPAPPRSDTATPERNKAEEEGTCTEPTNTVVGVKKGGVLRRAWAMFFWRR